MVRAAATPDKSPVLHELTIEAEESQLGRVRDFVVEACQEAGFGLREISNTKLAVDEACTNIIKHAYGGGDDGGDIRVRAEIEAGRVRITLRDRGAHFDFSSVKDPDLNHYVETGRKGGLGVFLINRLMDGVEYHSTDMGNELVLTKRSQAALSAAVLPRRVPMRGTLRFRFMVRASGGLALLVAVLWGFVFFRQTRDIDVQRATQWMEKRRFAENVASRSVPVLMDPSEFSIQQTNLSAELSKLLGSNDQLAYARVADATGQIRASGTIGEVFLDYKDPGGETLLDEGRVVWKRHAMDGRDVRDISVAVTVQDVGGGPLEIGRVHLGVYEDAIEAAVDDTRVATSLLLLAIFGVGILLVIGLVQVFVKPIQILTDGVRAIGDGNLEGTLDVHGPAEIGAIAAVFNEITEKFRKARSSILEQEKMQKEIEVAKQIQQSLLPKKRPSVSGYDIAPLYQAAAEVGGDYYDFVQVDDDTIGVVVADVSGKGVPGSLVMTMIRTALRMEARGNRNASDVMAKMNAFVTDDMKKGMFVTMFYVILDSKNRVISYASAGHNPMILYRHATKETFFLNPRGFPVGISLPDETLFQRSISLEKIRLKKDDMLLIYTDGVTEAMNERREQYGEDRLVEMVKTHGQLSPEKFIDMLDDDIKRFTSGFPQNDDITVVAIKEKLTADDVLFGIRKKLIELVDIQGMSVREACRQMRVSPTTYYRYKKRLELMGERGLRNDVLRDDIVFKRISLEARKEILRIIAENPDFGSKRITEEYNQKLDPLYHITERMVYEELKRLNLNTKELRAEYLRRIGLAKGEVGAAEGAAALRGGVVEDLLREIPGVALPREQEEAAAVSQGSPRRGEPGDWAAGGIEGVGVVVSTTNGITEVRVAGHLDSASSSGLERKLRELIARGATKLVVDLARVSYVSSGGWGIFSGEVRALRERQGDIVLAGMTSEVYDVYELLGFADILRAFPTTAEARAYLELPPEERSAVPAPARAAWGVEEVAASHGISSDDETAPGVAAREWESLGVEATTVGARGEIAVLELRGIIDTVSAEKLRESLSEVIARGLNKVVVDMAQVEYVSSGGWGVFAERLREVRRAGGDIKLFGMDPDVYYVFTMLGFNVVLSSFDILADAIDDFKRGAPEGALEPGGPRARPQADEASPLEHESAEPLVLETADQPEAIVWQDGPSGVRIARLSGALAAAANARLADELTRELSMGPRTILFDLTGVTYVSSAGWGQFARAYEAVGRWGGRVALFGMRPEIAEVYACLEFHEFIEDYASEDEAIRAAPTRREVPPQRSAERPPADQPSRREEETGRAAPPEEETGAVLDEVLGPASKLPDAPQVRNWPVAPTEPADEPAPTAPPIWGRGRGFQEPAGPPPEVDVRSARADAHIERDKKIREIGWQKYGEKLRGGKGKGGKNGEGEEGDAS